MVTRMEKAEVTTATTRPIRKCMRGSGDAKEAGIHIKNSVKRDQQFIKGIIGIHPCCSDVMSLKLLSKCSNKRRLAN